MSTEPAPLPKPAASGDPYAVMRPRWGRGVARGAAIVVAVTFTLAAVFIPGDEAQKGDWSLGDRAMIFVLGALIAWFLWRFGSIQAVPSKDGLVVRNLLITRTVSWAEILRVQFGGGAPWAVLDLIDTDTLAVMAIQKADGPHGRVLASRLAALIQVHSRADEPPDSHRPAPDSPS